MEKFTVRSFQFSVKRKTSKAKYPNLNTSRILNYSFTDYHVFFGYTDGKNGNL